MINETLDWSVKPAESAVVSIPLSQCDTKFLREAFAGRNIERSHIESTRFLDAIKELSHEPNLSMDPIRVVKRAGGTYTVVDGLWRTMVYQQYCDNTHRPFLQFEIPAVLLSVAEEDLTAEYVLALSVYYNTITNKTWYSQADLKKLAKAILPNHWQWLSLFGPTVQSHLRDWEIWKGTPMTERVKQTMPSTLASAERLNQTVAQTVKELGLEDYDMHKKWVPPAETTQEVASSSKSLGTSQDTPNIPIAKDMAGEHSPSLDPAMVGWGETPKKSSKASGKVTVLPVEAAGKKEKPSGFLSHLRGRAYMQYVKKLTEGFEKGIVIGALPTDSELEAIENMCYLGLQRVREARKAKQVVH